MRRREFIALFGGAAACPSSVLAQERLRRVGILMTLAENDQEAQGRIAAFVQALREAGWTEGRNLTIEYRWGAGKADLYSKYAAELVALAPDAILANGAANVTPLQKETRTIPIVFVQVADPVGSGFVQSLSRPGANITGFLNFENSIAAKWLELLKQAAPNLRRVAVLRDAANPSGTGQLSAVEGVATALGVEVVAIGPGTAGEVERHITAFAAQPGGLIITSNATVSVHRDLIISLAARYRLPAVYAFSYYVARGGLISYSPDTVAPFRDAAGYVNRILRGENPANLPVQAQTKYDLVINVKTAKELGLELPPTLLARADEVIE